MHSISRSILLSFSLFLSQLVFGQNSVNGVFTRMYSSFGGKTEEFIRIKKDSIWFSRKKYGPMVLSGEKFSDWIGTIMYHQKACNNKPCYSGWLMVMSCDTCPEFWKNTLKSADSLSIDPIVYTYGKTDTIIENGDTSYTTPQFNERRAW